MSNIYIAGIAMTVFGRHPERSIEDLAGEALRGALADAGCTAGAIGAAFYSGITNGALQGQLSVPGQVVFSKTGVEGIPVFNVENACASGSTAVHLAVQHLRAGACDVALTIGAEKMNVPDKARSFALFEGGGTCPGSRRISRRWHGWAKVSSHRPDRSQTSPTAVS